jgi:hypothetical protein
MVTLSPADIHHLGLTVIHQLQELPSDFKATGNGVKYRHFRAFYSVDPETCCNVLADIHSLLPADLRINKPDPSHLLMMLEWVTLNKKEVELQGLYAIKSDKTVRKWLWMYRFAIRGLKPFKV